MIFINDGFWGKCCFFARAAAALCPSNVMAKEMIEGHKSYAALYIDSKTSHNFGLDTHSEW